MMELMIIMMIMIMLFIIIFYYKFVFDKIDYSDYDNFIYYSDYKYDNDSDKFLKL